MLVLTRRPNQSIVIGGGEIVVTVLEVRGDQVRIGIKALHAGRMSIVPGLPNRFMAMFMRTTPRRLRSSTNSPQSHRSAA